VLQAENLSACTNVYLLRGIIELGRLLTRAPKDVSSACMSATDVWHTYVCCHASSAASYWCDHLYVVYCVYMLLRKLSVAKCSQFIKGKSGGTQTGWTVYLSQYQRE